MMFGVKVVALLALALVVAATDLEDGLAIMACARRAINGGVPELNIPSHDPFVVIKHNFSWRGDIGILLTNAQINFTAMTWAGLGTWELTATQHSKDVDKNAVFDFKLYWKKMEIKGKYDAEENAAIIHTEQHGDFSLVIKESAWTGSINVTKPDKVSNGTVNSVKIDWDVDDLDVTVHGLGLIDGPVALTVATTLKTALNTHLIGNAVGDFIKMRLETIWWNTGKVWDLVQWCQDHPANSTFY